MIFAILHNLPASQPGNVNEDTRVIGLCLEDLCYLRIGKEAICNFDYHTSYHHYNETIILCRKPPTQTSPNTYYIVIDSTASLRIIQMGDDALLRVTCDYLPFPVDIIYRSTQEQLRKYFRRVSTPLTKISNFSDPNLN